MISSVAVTSPLEDRCVFRVQGFRSVFTLPLFLFSSPHLFFTRMQTHTHTHIHTTYTHTHSHTHTHTHTHTTYTHTHTHIHTHTHTYTHTHTRTQSFAASTAAGASVYVGLRELVHQGFPLPLPVRVALRSYFFFSSLQDVCLSVRKMCVLLFLSFPLPLSLFPSPSLPLHPSPMISNIHKPPPPPRLQPPPLPPLPPPP